MNPSTPQPLAQFSGTLVLAGAGKMGGALLSGWLAQGLNACDLAIIEPHPSADITALTARGVRINPPLQDLGAVSTLVIAVKPQMFREAGPALRALVGPGALVLSIMAGTPIAAITQVCGGSVVRAMPNTPAAIGRGITVAVGAPNVGTAQRATTKP
jgi:pyrroline-5-carboxylate reductase